MAACSKCGGIIIYKRTDTNGYASIYEAVCRDCGIFPGRNCP